MTSKQGVRLVLLVIILAMGGTFWRVLSPPKQGVIEPAASVAGAVRSAPSGRTSVKPGLDAGLW